MVRWRQQMADGMAPELETAEKSLLVRQSSEVLIFQLSQVYPKDKMR